MLNRIVATNRGSRGNGSQGKKSLLVLLITFLTLYAPIELTRVIIDWGLAGKFIFEVCLIWLFYATAIYITSVVVVRQR